MVSYAEWIERQQVAARATVRPRQPLASPPKPVRPCCPGSGEVASRDSGVDQCPVEGCGVIVNIVEGRFRPHQARV